MKKLVLSASILFLSLFGASQVKIFDLHVHLSEGQSSLQQYVKQLDTSHLTVTRFGGILIAGKGQPKQTRVNNDNLLALAKQYPALFPICSVHPLDGDTAIQELRRLSKLGVRMIKIHPLSQSFDVRDAKVLKLWQAAGELGVVVLMDNAGIKPADCESLFDLAVKNPKTTFVFAHMGGLNFRFWNLLPLARTARGFFMDNIYFDVSATSTLLADSPLEEEFIWTLRNIGINRILLGSDFPQFTLQQTLNALDRLNLEETEKNRIRYDNANEMFIIGQ